MTYNYLILQPGTDISGFDDRIAGVVEKYRGGDMKSLGNDITQILSRITEKWEEQVAGRF